MAAASSTVTVNRSCFSHERRRRSLLLLLAEEVPAPSAMGQQLRVSTKDTTKKGTLECRRLVVVVMVVRTWCNAGVSVQSCAHVQLIKKASTNVRASSAGLTSRKPLRL